mmetsp:Transcript_22159/g.61668  ORF Transcript_22159/g.61668 Transcript_22159/m.61668 type:complete len:206 (+) Transcript_22159:2674-3291(+)
MHLTVVARHHSVHVFRVFPRFAVVNVVPVFVGQLPPGRPQKSIAGRNVPQGRTTRREKPESFVFETSYYSQRLFPRPADQEWLGMNHPLFRQVRDKSLDTLGAGLGNHRPGEIFDDNGIPCVVVLVLYAIASRNVRRSQKSPPINSHASRIQYHWLSRVPKRFANHTKTRCLIYYDGNQGRDRIIVRLGVRICGIQWINPHADSR